MIEIFQTIERLFSAEKTANKVFEIKSQFPLNFEKISLSTLSKLKEFPHGTLFRLKFKVGTLVQYYWLVKVETFGYSQLFALEPSLSDPKHWKFQQSILTARSFLISLETLSTIERVYMALQKNSDNDTPEIEQFEIHHVFIGETDDTDTILLATRFAV